jgi:hypothetical protein
MDKSKRSAAVDVAGAFSAFLVANLQELTDAALGLPNIAPNVGSADVRGD